MFISTIMSCKLGKCHRLDAIPWFCDICGPTVWFLWEYCYLQLVKLAVACGHTVRPIGGFLVGGAFQWNGCKERCLCLTGLAHSAVAHLPISACLPQSAPSKTYPEAGQERDSLRTQTVDCACGRKPGRGYSTPPSCSPGYWVTLATGKALSRALGRGGGVG